MALRVCQNTAIREGFEQLNTFHPTMNLQLTLWTIGQCESCLEFKNDNNKQTETKVQAASVSQAELPPGFCNGRHFDNRASGVLIREPRIF